MKDTMNNLMVSIMLMMKPFMWLAAAIVMMGILLRLSNFVLNIRLRISVIWSGRLVLVVAVFFLAAQLVGTMLNMPSPVAKRTAL